MWRATLVMNTARGANDIWEPCSGESRISSRGCCAVLGIPRQAERGRTILPIPLRTTHKEGSL